jgi:hypothetical protein
VHEDAVQAVDVAAGGDLRGHNAFLEADGAVRGFVGAVDDLFDKLPLVFVGDFEKVGGGVLRQLVDIDHHFESCHEMLLR